jgi:cell wall-associated NlpC family hydrolase
MTRPTAAALAFARSTLPVRRVASTGPTAPGFAALLKAASTTKPVLASPQVAPRIDRSAPIYHAAMLAVDGGLASISRSEILSSAQQLMNVPYVWGGTAAGGLDCSAFVSKVWGVARQTTDTLATVSHPISKDELQPGDALNLTTGRDPEGDGHVRLFDRWADAGHTKMYVYEETPPRSIHHVINWDPRYQPMRRNNVIDA